MCNFTNICHSLAYRHQQRFLFSVLSGEHCRDVTVVEKFNMVPVNSVSFCSALCSKFGISSEDIVAVSDRLNIASVESGLGTLLS